MARYRRKPVVIEAEQFMDPSRLPVGVFIEEDGRVYVMTAHHQKVYLEPGDWIIPEPNGQGYYPCKPDIFASTYEPVD